SAKRAAGSPTRAGRSKRRSRGATSPSTMRARPAPSPRRRSSAWWACSRAPTAPCRATRARRATAFSWWERRGASWVARCCGRRRRRGQRGERFGGLGVVCRARPCARPRVLDGVLRVLHSRGIGLAGNAAQEFFLVQEEITGEDILAVKLLEEIAGRNSDPPKGLVGML